MNRKFTKRAAQLIAISLGLALMAACSGSGSDTDSVKQIKKSGTIKVAYANDRPPWNMIVKGKRRGLGPDLFAVVTKDLGVKAKWIPYGFDGMIPALSSNRAVVAVDQLFITDERAKQVDFTDPLYGWSDKILLNKKTNETFNSLEDLKNKKVGVLAGSIQYEKLSKIKGVNVVTYKTTLSLAMDLANGRVDAGLVDPPSIAPLRKERPDIALKFDKNYIDPDKHYVGWAVKKGDTALAKELNRIIGQMKADGKIRELVDKYLGPEIEIPTSQKD